MIKIKPFLVAVISTLLLILIYIVSAYSAESKVKDIGRNMGLVPLALERVEMSVSRGF
ncbi:hypothetical protein [Microbulbifer variabilis]|uniref:Methyl-accepting chemotaxis protein n=1 Tax=Microbulbifer variabilis TaxID=266805 RepID=A0ABY4V858_9GAMM|nr:hypothetical protein [Microbulbifer variabilis]USD20443.1 hypothetical protein MJO52_15365 [Microbulbifer variabilis]